MPRWAPTAASSSSNTSRTTTARPSSPSASGRRSTTCRRASCTRTRRRSRKRCGSRATRAGSRCRRCCSAASSTTTAPTPSCACSASSAGSRPSGWSLHRTYLRASELERRARRRRRCSSAGPNADAVDGRAGVPVRAPAAPAQYRQHVAAAARLGDVAASRLEPAPAARRGAALARGLLRRHRGQDRARPAHRQRLRLDVALSRHHAARRVARPRDRRAACRPRPPTRVPPGPINQLRIAILEKVRPVGLAQPQCRASSRPAHRVRGAGQGAHRPVARVPRAHAEGRRRTAQRRR